MSQRTISTLKSRTHHVVNGYLFTSQGHILPVQCLQKCYSRACLTSPVSSKLLLISQEHIFPLWKFWKCYTLVKCKSFLSCLCENTTHKSRAHLFSLTSTKALLKIQEHSFPLWFLQNATPKSEAHLSPLVSAKVMFLCKCRTLLIGHYLSTVHATGKSKKKVIQTLASHLVRSLFFIIWCFWFMVEEWKVIWASWGK